MKKFLVLLLSIMLLAGIASAEEEANDILGKPFPDFTVTDTEGNTFTLSEALKDHKAALINFWATWCEPCAKEFPFLNEAYQKYGDRVAFIALSNEQKDTIEKIAEYRKESGIAFPMGRDEDLTLTKYLGDKDRVPNTVVVDRFGNAVYFHEGAFKKAQEVERVLDSLLGDSYTETVVLNGIPMEASTRAFPVYAARAIYPESGNYRKIKFHLADFPDPIIGYIVPEDSVRLRIEIAANDVVANMLYAEGTDFTDVTDLLDPEKNIYVYEQKIPDVTAEEPYVDAVLLDGKTASEVTDYYRVILFRDEACISKALDYLKSWDLGEVSWEYADEDEKAGNEPKTYILHVIDQFSNPVGEVTVNFCTDTACTPQETDKTGTITYKGEPYKYHVQIIDVPEGYSWDETFDMYTTQEYGEWTLRIRKD
jgi:thiol-disulfide isomerase/thioredoxin